MIFVVSTEVDVGEINGNISFYRRPTSIGKLLTAPLWSTRRNVTIEHLYTLIDMAKVNITVMVTLMSYM